MYVVYITRRKWVPQNTTRALRARVVFLAEPATPRDVTCTNCLDVATEKWFCWYAQLAGRTHTGQTEHPEGVQALAEALRTNPRLHYLSLTRNVLGPKCAVALASLLLDESLEDVDLAGTHREQHSILIFSCICPHLV